MSREWYIRTDKRHIEKTAYTPSPSPSKQEVFRKNRGKYVAYAIFGVFAVLCLIFAFPVLFEKDNPDYTVTLVTAAPASETLVAELEQTVKANGKDLNGDGEVSVAIRQISTNNDPAILINTFQTGEYSFLVMERPSYERFVAPYTAEGVDLFQHQLTEKPLSDTVFLWGVRSMPEKASAAQKQAAEQNARLLDAILAD